MSRGFERRLVMMELGKIESVPVNAKNPQTLSYKSVDWRSKSIGIVFYSPSFGNPLLEEKPTHTILTNIKETTSNLKFAAELSAWDAASDEALALFEAKLD